MFQTLLTALRLIWISATDKDTKIRLIFSYVFGVSQGVIAFVSPVALSEMIKQISQKNIEGTLFYFYLMIALAVAVIVSRFVWRFGCEQITRIYRSICAAYITLRFSTNLMTGICKTVSGTFPPY